MPMTQEQKLHHALYWLPGRFSPVEIVEALAKHLEYEREEINDIFGIDSAADDLRRLAKKWRMHDPRRGGA